MGVLVASQFAGGRPSSSPGWWFFWWPLLSAALSTSLALIKDIVFIVWGRTEMYLKLRERATMGIGQPRIVPTLSAPAGMPLPPVVPAQS